ncbi:MAG: hypothetical protein LBP26_02850, partial [Clostridiales bacterium]|nr:hypothetical protein [Clostridiales bacterium]
MTDTKTSKELATRRPSEVGKTADEMNADIADRAKKPAAKPAAAKSATAKPPEAETVKKPSA